MIVKVNKDGVQHTIDTSQIDELDEISGKPPNGRYIEPWRSMCDRPPLPEFQCPGLVQRRLAIIFGLCGVVRFPEIGRTAPVRG